MSDLDNLDLDIANYDLDDILNLFQLNIYFTEDDLRNVKKYVLLTHPDKSKLPDKYFLFFKEAYDQLVGVYNFRHKKETKREKAENLMKNTENIFQDHQKNKKEFNKRFNELFEKYVPNANSENGYGEWLQKKSETTYSCNNRREMNDIIENKKTELSALTKFQDIKETTQHSIDNIDGTTPDGYQSALFSKLTFDDLKHAHEESVIPVTIHDMKQSPSGVEEMKAERSAFINPSENAHAILMNKQENEDKSAAYRAHRLLQQDEIARKATQNWIGGFKHLTNS